MTFDKQGPPLSHLLLRVAYQRHIRINVTNTETLYLELNYILTRIFALIDNHESLQVTQTISPCLSANWPLYPYSRYRYLVSQAIASRRSGIELMSIGQPRSPHASPANQFFIHRLSRLVSRDFGAGNGGKRLRINTVSWSRVDCGVDYGKER